MFVVTCLVVKDLFDKSKCEMKCCFRINRNVIYKKSAKEKIETKFYKAKQHVWLKPEFLTKELEN